MFKETFKEIQSRVTKANSIWCWQCNDNRLEQPWPSHLTLSWCWCLASTDWEKGWRRKASGRLLQAAELSPVTFSCRGSTALSHAVAAFSFPSVTQSFRFVQHVLLVWFSFSKAVLNCSLSSWGNIKIQKDTTRKSLFFPLRQEDVRVMPPL